MIYKQGGHGTGKTEFGYKFFPDRENTSNFNNLEKHREFGQGKSGLFLGFSLGLSLK